MNKEAFAVRPDSEQYINGIKVTTTLEKPVVSIVNPTDVEYHEAEHAVVAVRKGTGVRRARARSGKGYGGIVEPYSLDLTAAATSHKRSGNTHDMGLIKAAGVNPDAVIAEAEEIMGKNQKEIYSVASLLHFKGDVSGYEVEEAMEDANKPQEAKMIVNLKGPNGEEKTIERTVIDGQTMIPGIWVDFSTN